MVLVPLIKFAGHVNVHMLITTRALEQAHDSLPLASL